MTASPQTLQKMLYTAIDRIAKLEAQVQQLEDNNGRNRRIIELEQQVYELQQRQYRMQSQIRQMEITNYLKEHYG